MGITGLYIDDNILKNISTDTDINALNLNLNAYYIIDSLNFFYEYIDNNYTEETFVSITINIYNLQEDRKTRINQLDTIYYQKKIDKKIDYGNLWNTLYTEFKQFLIEKYENVFKLQLNLIELPNEYKNIIVFNDS